MKKFSDFCLAKFKQSDESIISELLKQKPNDMTINSCDLFQQWINSVSKTLSPSTIKVYLSHIKGYFNYRGIKLTSLDKKTIRYPKEIKEEKFPLSKEDIKSGIGEILHFYYYSNSPYIKEIANTYDDLIINPKSLLKFINDETYTALF